MAKDPKATKKDAAGGDELTLTTTADTGAAEQQAQEVAEKPTIDANALCGTAPRPTVLGHLHAMIAQAEQAGDPTRAGILHNLAVRVSELKLHAGVAADLLDGDAAELVSQLRDGL